MSTKTKEGIEVKVGQVWTTPDDGHKREYRVNSMREGGDVYLLCSHPLSSILKGTRVQESDLIKNWKLIKDTDQ